MIGFCKVDVKVPGAGCELDQLYEVAPAALAVNPKFEPAHKVKNGTTFNDATGTTAALF